jgi:cytochrome oxidase assembly protein ShyY1
VTPRWLGACALATLFAFACYHLGWWQYDRHEAKSQRNERLDAYYRADPVPLAAVLTPAGLAVSDEWTRVRVRGSYRAGPVFVRGRTREGEPGLEVLWALLPDGGGPTVIVDRGWVPESDDGARVLPRVSPAPDDRVDVIGWVRRGERSRGRDLPRGQLASLNISEAAAELGSGTLPGYLLLESERGPDGSTPPRPEPLGLPDRNLGPHLAYAYQWWFGMTSGFVLVWLGVRREVRTEHPERYPTRPTKVRIWDEEDG